MKSLISRLRVFVVVVSLTLTVQAQNKTSTATQFIGTSTTTPDFVAGTVNGTPPLQVSSTTQVNNLNVDFVNGFHASAFPKLGTANTFTANQTINGTLAATALQVGSTSLVTNLNADFLDGFHASAFPLLGASNTFTANQTVNGTVTANSFFGNGSALTGVRPDIPSTRSHLSGSPFAITPSSDQQHAVPVDWNDVQYDTIGATQTSPWRYVAPTSGRYRVSSFIRYTPNGSITAGQVVQVEVFVNGTLDYGGMGGFQADSDMTGTTDLFLHGEDEIPVNAGDQITINIFQNTAQTGYVTSASHILVERVGDLDGARTEPWN